jgi:hypothetical protein
MDWSEGKALDEIWSVPVPENKVRYWCSDGQEGGWVDFVTPEEAKRRDDLKDRACRGDQEAANQITWEEFPSWMVGIEVEED